MQATLSDLFRKIEADIGTHEFCVLALGSLKSALKQYKIKSNEELMRQLISIFNLIKETKPRYAILMDSFYRFLEAYNQKGDEKSVNDLLDDIERIKISYKLEGKLLTEAARSIDVKGKNILIYDHSHSVQHALEFYVKKHKSFNVIIAEQDIDKTEDSIAFCHKLEVPYKVVPSYMLSHIDDSIDMIFSGAVTFQDGYQFVMDPGSKSIISHFYLEKKPVYVFLTTSKFSLWPVTEAKPTIYSKHHKRHHHSLKEIEFERIKFSHDRVPLKLISHIVTEKGIFSQKELRTEFDDMFKKRAKERRRYGKQ